jgi:HSP20 family protein
MNAGTPSSSRSRGLQPRRGLASRERGSDMPSLFGGGPVALLRQLDEDLDRLFQEFSGGQLSGPGIGSGGDWMPQIEMCERDGRLHVYADLPGLSKDDIKVDVDDGRLTMQGERRASSEDRSQGVYRSERSYGSFYRSVVLDISFEAPQDQRGRTRSLQISDGPSPSSNGGSSTKAPAR